MVAVLGCLGVPARGDVDEPLAALLQILEEFPDFILAHGQLDGATVLEAAQLQGSRVVERSLQDTRLLRTLEVFIGVDDLDSQAVHAVAIQLHLSREADDDARHILPVTALNGSSVSPRRGLRGDDARVGDVDDSLLDFFRSIFGGDTDDLPPLHGLKIGIDGVDSLHAADPEFLQEIEPAERGGFLVTVIRHVASSFLIFTDEVIYRWRGMRERDERSDTAGR